MKFLLATRNRTKIALYRDILRDIIDIYSPIDLEFPKIHLEETLNDAQINADMKASAYANLDSTIFVLGEDTALEIPIINNLPGPAIRRWGGELSDDISDDDWIKLFRKKITPLAKKGKVACFKIHKYTLIYDGEKYNHTLTVPFNIKLRNMPKNIQYLDGPLSFFLFHEELKKYENDFTKEDKDIIYKDVRKFIFSIYKSN